MVEILDDETKKEIKAVIDEGMKELRKSWKSESNDMKKSLDKEIKGKKKVAGKAIDKEKKKLEMDCRDKAEEYIESFKENPMEWVAGAFVAGLLLGGLFRK